MTAFHTKGIYVTDDNWNPGVLIADLQNSGFRYVVFEDTPRNRANFPNAIGTLQGSGFNCGVWWRENAAGAGWTPDNSMAFWAGLNLWVADLESAADRLSFISQTGGPAAFAANHPGVNLAVSTTDPAFQTGGVYDSSLSAPWIAAGFRVHPQNYTPENPNDTMANQIFAYVNQLCWPWDWVMPTIEVKAGVDASIYCAQMAAASPVAWSVYYYQGMKGAGILPSSITKLQACNPGSLLEEAWYVPPEATFGVDGTFAPQGLLSNPNNTNPCGAGNNNPGGFPALVGPTDVPNGGAAASKSVGSGQAFGTKIGTWGLAIPNGATINQVLLTYTYRLTNPSSNVSAFIVPYATSGAVHQYFDSLADGNYHTVTHDVTADRAWVWSDFANVNFFVTVGGSNPGGPAGSVFIDSVFVRVLYTLLAPPPPPVTDSGTNAFTGSQKSIRQAPRDTAKNVLKLIASPAGPSDVGTNSMTLTQPPNPVTFADAGKNLMIVAQKGAQVIPGEPTDIWPCAGTKVVYSGPGLVNPGNVCQADGIYATAAVAVGGVAGERYGLFGLDALIPPSATITRVRIVSFGHADGVAPAVTLRQKARVGGTDQANHDHALGLADTIFVDDVTADRAWTRADLLDGTFEMVIEARG